MGHFRLLPEARADLEEIRDFIAQENPDAADRVVDTILDAAAALAHMPNIGHRRPDLTTGVFRFRRVHSYLIVYAPSESPVLVVAILHGSREPDTLAAILDSRDQTE